MSGGGALWAQLTATATNVNAVPCAWTNSGAVTITASGGTPPYRYSRDGGLTYVANPTFTNLYGGAHVFIVRDNAGERVHVPVFIPSPPPLVATVNIEPISACGANDGGIFVEVEGGTPPYQISLNYGPFGVQNQFANLSPGQYYIRVRDAAGCSAFRSVNLFNPTLLNATVNVVPPTGCTTANGVIEITPPTTGTPPYEYSLNWGAWQAGNTFAGLPTGYYRVRVRDAEACTFEKNVTLNYSSQLWAWATPTVMPACPGMGGGSAEIHVSGGTPPYNLFFNGTNYGPVSNATVSNLTAGQTYTGFVSDAGGCSRSFSFYMPAAPNTLTLETETVQPDCFQNNGEIRITVNGGTPPYTFAFNNGQTLYTNPAVLSGLTSGNYSVVVSDAGGCSKNASFQLTNSIVVETNVVRRPICWGSTTGILEIHASGSTGPYEYSINGGQSWQTNNVFTGLTAEIYQIRVRDASAGPDNGCTQGQWFYLEPETFTFTPHVTQAVCGGEPSRVWIEVAPQGYDLDFSLTGNAFQADSVFNDLPAGVYQIFARDPVSQCVVYQDSAYSEANALEVFPPFDLAVESLPSGCAAPTGRLEVFAAGAEPFVYALNDGAYQNQSVFEHLAPGDYVVRVRDAEGCVAARAVTVENNQPFFVSGGRANVSGPGASNGYIYIYAWPNPALPLTIVVNGVEYVSNNAYYQIQGLPIGDYEIVVTNADGCSQTLNFVLGFDAGNLQNLVTGVVFEDWNQNGLRDENEAPIPRHLVYVTTETGSAFYRYTTTDSEGRYAFNLPAGNYRLYANHLFHSEQTAPTEAYYALSFAENSSMNENLDFGLGFEPVVDAAVTLTAVNNPVAGGVVRYYLTAKNMGTTTLDGRFTFERAAGLTGMSSVVAPSASNPPFYTWDYADLAPFAFANLAVDCNVPTNAAPGSWYVGRANIEPTVGDAFLPNNAYTCSTQVRPAPYDPNVKLAMNDEGAVVDTILETDALTYFIRFRNEGEGPAENVVVVDTLPEHLDPRTFEMLGSSFATRHKITGEGMAVVEWRMEGIQLPPAQSDDLGSYGFVKFKIKPFENRPCETLVSNRAAVYFDYNEPIFTEYSRVLVDPKARAQIHAPDTVWVNETFVASASDVVNFRDSHTLAWSNGATGLESSFAFSTPGPQTLALTLTGPEKSDCGTTVTQSVYVKACPTPTNYRVNHEICSDSTLVLDASGMTGAWADGYAGAVRPVNQAKSYVFEIFLGGPCKDSYTYVVDVKNCDTPCPPTDLPDERVEICPFESTTLVAPRADAAYRWTNGETSRQLTADKEGEYEVEQTDAEGCVERVKFVVRYKSCEGNAPSNVFTPNGDGRNDYWTIDGHGIERVQAWVSDRTGTVVFSHDGAAGFKWNGLYQGAELPSGVYFHRYRLTMRDGRNVDGSGTITILR